MIRIAMKNGGLTVVSQAVKLAAKHVAKNKLVPKPVRDVAKVVEKVADVGTIIG